MTRHWGTSFPLMFLAFAGCMYLIFAPSGKDKTEMCIRDRLVCAFAAHTPNRRANIAKYFFI